MEQWHGKLLKTFNAILKLDIIVSSFSVIIGLEVIF